MATTKKNIGKIPIMKGEYQEGTTYQRLNQVTMLGSSFQSKIDDNTSAPAQMGADGAVEYINTDKWLCIAVGNVSAAKKVVYNNETSGLEAGNVQEAIDETNTKISNLSAQYDDMYYDGSNIHLKGVTFVVKQAGKGIGKAKDITIKKDGNIHYMYWLSSDANTYMPFYSVERYSNSEKKEYFVIEETIDWSALGTRDIQDCLLFVGNHVDAVFGILKDEYLNANTTDISNSSKLNSILKELYIRDSAAMNDLVDGNVEVGFYRGYKIGENSYITGMNIRKGDLASESFKTFLVSDYAGDADACYKAAHGYTPDVLDINGTRAVIDWNKLSNLNETTLLSIPDVSLLNERVLSLTDNHQCGFATKAEKTEVATELEKKFDKGSILQVSGEAEDKVMSQKAVSAKLSDLSHSLTGLKPLFSKIDDVENRLIFKNCSFLLVSKAKGVGIEADITIDTSKNPGQYWLSSTEGKYTPFYVNNLNNDNRQAYYVISDEQFDWENIKERDYRDLLLLSGGNNLSFGILADAIKEHVRDLQAKKLQEAVDEIPRAIALSAQYSRNIINKKDSFILHECTFVQKDKGQSIGKSRDIKINKGEINQIYWLSSTEGEYTPFFSNNIGLPEKQPYHIIKDEMFDWGALGKRDYRDLLLLIGNTEVAVYGILAKEYLYFLRSELSISDNYLFNEYFKELYISNEKLDECTANVNEINIYKGLKLGDIYITGLNILIRGSQNNSIRCWETFTISDYTSEDECRKAAEGYNPNVYSKYGVSSVIDWSIVPVGMVNFKNITLYKERVSSLIQNQRCAIDQELYGLSNYQFKKEEIGALYNTDGVTLHTEHNTFYTTDYIKVDKPTLFYGNFYRGDSTLVDSAYIYDSNKTFIRSFKTSKADDYVMVYPNTYVRFTYEHSGDNRITGYNRLFYAKDIRTCIQNVYESRWKGKTVYWFGDSLIHNGMITSAFEKLTQCVTKNFAYGARTMANITGDRLCVYDRMEDNLGDDADLIIISSGVNDHRSGVELGEFKYATPEAYIKANPGMTIANYRMTFYGILHTICKFLIAKYNQRIPIVFLTPMHNAYPINEGDDTWEIDKNKWENEGIIEYRKANPINGSSGTLPDYIKAIKEVAEFYGMQVIDTHAISSLQPSVISIAKEYFLAKEDGGIDGIHPNYMGSERICKMILPYLEQLDYSVIDTNRKFYQ